MFSTSPNQLTEKWGLYKNLSTEIWAEGKQVKQSYNNLRKARLW